MQALKSRLTLLSEWQTPLFKQELAIHSRLAAAAAAATSLMAGLWSVYYTYIIMHRRSTQSFPCEPLTHRSINQAETAEYTKFCWMHTGGRGVSLEYKSHILLAYRQQRRFSVPRRCSTGTHNNKKRCRRRVPTWYAAVHPIAGRLRCWQ